MTDIVLIIQARVGSTRLPGKVMYPLGGQPALQHVVSRVNSADSVTTTVVATSTEPQDDVLEQYAPQFGAVVVRGSESNVQQRVYDAATKYEADIVVRITGDCPLIDPKTIDTVVSKISGGEPDYASNIITRTFPRGLDVEAFSYESFERVVSAATTQEEREHVTPYYRENPEEFGIVNVTSDQVFDDEKYTDRTELRLTLDEADDYHLLERIYDKIEYSGILPIRDAIDLVDAEELTKLNESVRQKKL